MYPWRRVVAAYEGAADARRAYLAGEVNFAFGGTSSYPGDIAPYVQKGEAMVLFQSGVIGADGKFARSQMLPPDVPLMHELYEKVHGKPPSGIEWEAYKKLVGLRSWPFALLLPPDTPDRIVQAYWAAASAMIKDSAYRKDFDMLFTEGIGAASIAGKADEAFFREQIVMPPDVRDWVKSTLPKYGVVTD